MPSNLLSMLSLWHFFDTFSALVTLTFEPRSPKTIGLDSRPQATYTQNLSVIGQKLRPVSRHNFFSNKSSIFDPPIKKTLISQKRCVVAQQKMYFIIFKLAKLSKNVTFIFIGLSCCELLEILIFDV